MLYNVCNQSFVSIHFLLIKIQNEGKTESSRQLIIDLFWSMVNMLTVRGQLGLDRTENADSAKDQVLLVDSARPVLYLLVYW